MLREKFPKMHQSAISASAKDEWGKLPARQKERLNAEARLDLEEFKKLHPNHFKDRAAKSKRKAALNQSNQGQPKKQKNAHSPPQPPPQPHQNQPLIADQAPTYQMEMVQPPDNQTDQLQQEQLDQTYDFQGAQIKDCTPINQTPQAVQTALNDPNNFLEEANISQGAQIQDCTSADQAPQAVQTAPDGLDPLLEEANISQGAQIKDCTSINQELQGVQTAPSGPGLFLEEANISQEAQLQGCTFGDQDLQAPANELPLFSEGDLFDFSLEGIDFDNIYYTGNDGDTTQLEGAPFFF
ncbi:hypothetical protein F5X98DRAFT_382438 [Xylaria grammica]|nr:hypothetical protein F5X98DRAFT_382438 [Xylaria grammica]